MKVFLVGFMGSGKSFHGRRISQLSGLPFFDLDEQVSNHAGKTIEKIFAEDGEEQFRLMEKDVLHLITESHAGFVMACGGGTPCFYNNIDFMNEAGITVWLNPPFHILLPRLLREKKKRPLINRLSDEELESFIIRKLAGRKIYYEQALIKTDEAEPDDSALLKEIFQA